MWKEVEVEEVVLEVLMGLVVEKTKSNRLACPLFLPPIQHSTLPSFGVVMSPLTAMVGSRGDMEKAQE